MDAANQLSLRSTIYIDLNNRYATEIRNDPTYAMTQEGLDFNKSNVNQIAAPPLKEGEFDVKLIVFVDSAGNRLSGEWDIVHHWVVSMPDGSIMDPSTGKKFATLEGASTQIAAIAADSGISIRCTL